VTARQKTQSTPSQSLITQPRGSDAGKKPPKIISGDELEYRIARLQIFMGYYVRRGCPIFTVGGLNQATDLDLLAIRYFEPFRRQMLITECKSGTLGPLDRIFWLSGVKSFVRADEAILVRKGTKWDIKDFAKRAGIEILDLFKISELEANFKITDREWPGISDHKFLESRLPAWNKTLANNPNWWEFYLTISSETSYEEPFAGINYLMQQLRLLTKSLKRTEGASFERKMVADGISQLCAFLMRISEQAFDLSHEDRKGFIEKGLKYGNLDSRFAERILNSAYNLTRQTIIHYTGKNYDVDQKLFQIPVPPGAREIHLIVDEILRLYPSTLNLPQICDLLLLEVYVKENRSGGWLKRIFPHADLARSVELVRTFLGYLVQAGACPKEVLESLELTGIENGHSKTPEDVAKKTDSTAKSADAEGRDAEQFRLAPPPVRGSNT
jgi:hypothetical protein